MNMRYDPKECGKRIARLRKKLEKAGLTDFITTKVGEGYIITQDAEGR